MAGNKGFTLIEIMIIIVIIGILAAIAIPAYQIYIARAQVSEAMSLLGTVKGGILETYTTSATCIDNNNNQFLGIAKAIDITGNYIASISTGGTAPSCTIDVQMKATGVAKPLQGGNLIFTMVTTDDSYQWQCGSTNIENIYLPASCR